MLDHAWTAHPGAGLRREDAPDARGVPGSAGAGQLQRRPGAGQAQGRRRRAR